jgi:NADH-quinone oxidoreductase subunit C
MTMPEVAHPRTVGLGGESIVFVPREQYRAAIEELHDQGYEMCVDVCAVDYLGHPGRTLPEGVAPERFEVVVNLLSLSRKERTRVRVQVPA